MPQYVVQKSCWVADPGQKARLRAVGESVTLTVAQASYLVMSGQLTPASDYSPPTLTPLAVDDVVVLRRQGVERVLQPSELAAFFASLYSGSTPVVTTPVTIPTNDNSLALTLDLASGFGLF